MRGATVITAEMVDAGVIEEVADTFGRLNGLVLALRAHADVIKLW